MDKIFVLDKIILSCANLILPQTKNVLSRQMDRAFVPFIILELTGVQWHFWFVYCSKEARACNFSLKLCIIVCRSYSILINNLFHHLLHLPPWHFNANITNAQCAPVFYNPTQKVHGLYHFYIAVMYKTD